MMLTPGGAEVPMENAAIELCDEGEDDCGNHNHLSRV